MASVLIQSASQNTISPATVSGKPGRLLGRQSGEAGGGEAGAGVAGAAGATGAGSRSVSMILSSLLMTFARASWTGRAMPIHGPALPGNFFLSADGSGLEMP